MSKDFPQYSIPKFFSFWFVSMIKKYRSTWNNKFCQNCEPKDPISLYLLGDINM